MTPEQMQQFMSQTMDQSGITGLQRFMFEHPGVVLTMQVLWYFWVAFALAMICFELHAHNAREEKREYQRRFKDEREERKTLAASKSQDPPENPFR